MALVELKALVRKRGKVPHRIPSHQIPSLEPCTNEVWVGVELDDGATCFCRPAMELDIRGPLGSVQSSLRLHGSCETLSC